MRTIIALCLLAGSLYAQPVSNVPAYITQNTTWYHDSIYLLSKLTIVKNAATLTIEPGTTIQGIDYGGLIITRGAKINAAGTALQPIVFTSANSNPNYGDWYGIAILGRSATNATYNGMPGIDKYLNSINDDFKFGGGDLPGGPVLDDSSGVMQYVRIQYAGKAPTPGNETKGLTLCAVGSRTVIDYIQSSFTDDDGFAWFGGTVNCKHLISLYNVDDDFDFDNGFRGKLQYLLAVRNPQVSDSAGASNGVEIDNDASATNIQPQTRAVISNMTIIGPEVNEATQFFFNAVLLKRNGTACIGNSLIMGDWDSFGAPPSLFNLDTFYNNPSGSYGFSSLICAGTFDTANFTSPGPYNNIFSLDGNCAPLVDPYGHFGPNDPQLGQGTLYYNTASFDNICFLGDSTFFDHIPYIGALDTIPALNWLNNWSSIAIYTLTDETEPSHNAVSINAYLAPTVVSDVCQLFLECSETSAVHISVTDTGGRLMRTISGAETGIGIQNYPIDATDWPAGMYLVQVQAGAKRGALKFMKQ